MTHIAVEHFAAITEFFQGATRAEDVTDACGPCSNEVCTACCEGRAPAVANMLAIRERDIAKGWFRTHQGQTLHELYEDATELGHMQVTEIPFGTPVETIHEALKAACLRGNPCVLNLALAGSLPGNEAGIRYHFIGIGGIDDLPSKGYLCANGDHSPPTFGPVGTYWVTWAAIAAAQPVGLLEFHMPTAAPVPASAPAPQATHAATPAPPKPPTATQALQAQVAVQEATIKDLQHKIAAAQAALA